MLNYLIIGTVLGFWAGITPGPLLTLVISETLQHDIKSGIKVALAPLVTDLPIVALTLFVLSKLSGFQTILGIISLLGAVFILFMGWESMRTKGVELNAGDVEQKSLRKGALVNALSPHPYLFGFSVGAPTMTKAMNLGISSSVAFVLSFYLLLVGSKVMLSILTGKSKSFLKDKAYLYTLRFLGLVLFAFAFLLFYEGLKLLQLI